MSALPSVGRADAAVAGADAARTLYERHGSRIFAFCYSRLGSREEAEDAAQTTFLNAFRSLQGGVVPQFELAWLFRIADNVCRDRRKSAWRRNRIEATRDLDELEDVSAPAPETGADGLVGLADALAAMPERQRRAILLREWQGLSYAEIARELDVSRAAVETLIFRARRSLARGLDAPPETSRGRRAGIDVGWLLGLAKSLFQGGAAVKATASLAALAGVGIVAVAPLRDLGADAPRPRETTAAPVAREIPAAPAGVTARASAGVAAPRPALRRGATVGAKRQPGRASLPRSAGPGAAPTADASSPTRSKPESPPTATASLPEPAAPRAPEPASPAPAPPPAAPAPPLPDLTRPPELPPVLPPAPPLEPPALPSLHPPAVPSLPELPVDPPELPGLP